MVRLSVQVVCVSVCVVTFCVLWPNAQTDLVRVRVTTEEDNYFVLHAVQICPQEGRWVLTWKLFGFRYTTIGHRSVAELLFYTSR